MKVVIIGSGNVGTHLAKRLKESEQTDIIQIISRSLDSARRLARTIGATYTNKLEEINSDLDLVLLAVSDDAIESILNQLPDTIQDRIVCHTSGSVPATIASQKFMNYGVIYPLQTFRIGTKVSWEKIPVFITASNRRSENTLLVLSKRLSDNVEKISDKQRQSLHLAAVFVCNFPNALYAVGEQICQTQNLDFRHLQPLITETADKIKETHPIDAQTGPARRHDKKVIDMHLKILSNQSELVNIYQALTRSIQEQARNKTEKPRYF